MAETPYCPPPVQSRSPKPPGILPRHARALVIGGISLVMVIVMAFSGGKAPKDKPGAPPQVASAVDPDDTGIEEYRKRIEQQAQKLALEQARFAQARQTIGREPGTATPGALDLYAGRGMNAPLQGEYGSAGVSEPERSWIDLDWEKRTHQSRFASNLALTHREPETPERQLDRNNGESAKDQNPTERPSNDDRALRKSTGKPYRVFEGTVLETVLTNRLDGSFSGPVNCMLTTNVYSHDRTKLLIPQGSRVLGEVSRVETFGQQRLAVTFQRLIMPDGYSVSLEKVPGLNQQGETGLVDKINHHYLQVFGVSVAIGAIASLSQAGTQYGASASAGDAYRQGVSNSLSQSSLNILDRYLNVLPTFTIEEGHRVKVYLTGDLLVPAYENHRLPSDL